MSLMLSFYRAYPLPTLLALLALLVAGLAEGIGLSVLLPLLNIAISTEAGADGGTPSAAEGDFEHAVRGALGYLGIEPTLASLLLVVVVTIGVKGVLLLVARRQVGYTAARLATDLRLELLRAILLSRWEYFLDQPVGKLTNSLATEASRASDAFVNGATALTFLVQAMVYVA